MLLRARLVAVGVSKSETSRRRPGSVPQCPGLSALNMTRDAKIEAPPAPTLDIAQFLGLRRDSPDERWSMVVAPSLCGGRGSIFGGCALAAAIEAAERQLARRTTWAACHFLGPSYEGKRLEIDVNELSRGRGVSHARVTGWSDGREVFSCAMALGERSFEANGTWAKMPRVPPPETQPHRYILDGHRGGIRETLEERAVTEDPSGVMHGPDGRAAVWVRLSDGVPGCASALALIGDEVSTGTTAVVHRDAQAPSIDNTLRVISTRACDWVLADIEIRAISRGFAHGIVNLWSPDGELLAIAEQTGALRIRGS